MKKQLLFISLFTLLASFSSAQLKVTTQGLVGIGTSTPDTNYKTTIQGSGLTIKDSQTPSNSVNIMTFTPYTGGNASIYITDISPSTGCNTSYIGYQKPWKSGYFTNLQAQSLTCTGTFYNYSDIQLKKNIKPLNHSFDVFSRLNPISFNYLDSFNTNNSKTLKFTNDSSLTLGFIAQEVQKLYPQLVAKDQQTGLLRIKTLEFIPILVKALQTQQSEIDALSELIKKTNSGLQKVKTNTTEIDLFDGTVLHQNYPNPFNSTTSISMYLPNSINNAAIYIYNMSGAQIKSYKITERGKTCITINSSEFEAGMYHYALIVDGKVIENKQMILTK